MSPDLQATARRVALAMKELADKRPDAEGKWIFAGLGIALAMCWEQATGQPATRRTPRQILQWGLDLAEVGKVVLQ